MTLTAAADRREPTGTDRTDGCHRGARPGSDGRDRDVGRGGKGRSVAGGSLAAHQRRGLATAVDLELL